MAIVQPHEVFVHESKQPSCLVIACGALANEIVLLCKINRLHNISLTCLPAKLHNEPAKIPDLLEEIIIAQQGNYDRILLGYGDCGTAGKIDALAQKYGVTRLDGAHCYAFFAQLDNFDALMEQEVGSFFLTDYLARFFEQLIVKGLGLDRHRDMKAMVFGNYQRLVYLAQTDDEKLQDLARKAADYLGLEYCYRFVGYGLLETRLLQISAAAHLEE